jgi:glutamate---cysteine ligase / carboxylate-amine ligase
LLLALSGDSPMWRGRDSGWESYRHEMFTRWPSARIPPVCDDAAAYDDALAERIATGEATDAAGVYWFARLSPRYPTVEIRIADTGLTVADTTWLAALCRSLFATALAEVAGCETPVAVPETLLAESLMTAARHGLVSLLIDPSTGVLAPGHVVPRASGGAHQLRLGVGR